MEAFEHCGQRFEPLGDGGCYYAVTSTLDDQGKTWAVHPMECPRFTSEASARKWAEYMESLEAETT